MSSLPLGGDFIKFAANNHRRASIQQALGRDNMRLNRFFDAPQNGHSCIPVNHTTGVHTLCVQTLDSLIALEKYNHWFTLVIMHFCVIKNIRT